MKKGGKQAEQAKRPSSNFKAQDWVRPGLSVEQVSEIKEAFDLFDTDQGGSIDTKGTVRYNCRT